ncbi:uncharacterized protein LOC113511680 isoform X2 [Galleria mellonella]|uniref:E3 ubiquitin-protein ligase n=1 Tax=Galleria mellonella TaxID=7137 RepID=A0ABM3MQX3_GALME|nr:uncharacterized protein LOC113511680 isoform X2 [Galleria mellonella]
MDNRKEKIKNSLVIGEYPWSSDDEENDNGRSQGAEILHSINLMRRQPDSSSPQASIGDQPGTSGEQPQSSCPSESSLRLSQSTMRKSQSAEDRHMFWSLLNNPSKYSISRLFDVRFPVPVSRVTNGASASSDGSGAINSGTSGVTSPGHSVRPDRIAAGEIQRVLAFKRFTRNLNAINAMRANNRMNCPTMRSKYGVPSRNPMFNGIVKRIYPGQSSTRYESSGSNNEELQASTHLNRQVIGAVDGNLQGGGELSTDRRGRTRGNDEFPLNFCGRHQTSENGTDLSHRPEIEDGEMPSTSGTQSAVEDEGVTGRPDLQNMDVDLTLDVTDDSGCGPVLEEVVKLEEAEEEAAPDGQGGGAGADSSAAAHHEAQGPASSNPEDSAGASQQQPRGVKRKREGFQESEPLTVSEFNQRLLRLLECPVCMDWMEAPIAQCRRGHLICSRCRERLSFCPVCRTTFSSVRNRAMEGVADLLRYPCRHGCGREVRIRRRARHEASCAARKYACPASLCAARAPLPHADLAHHFQNKHRDMLKIGRKHEFSMKVNLEHHDSWLIMALHEYFHLRVDVDVRSWGVIIYVAYIGPQCKAKNFTYEITINGQYNSRKLVYARVTHSDLESSTLNVSRQDCFHLTLDQALNFLRFKSRHREQDRYLDFNVEITKCGSTDSGGDGTDGSE